MTDEHETAAEAIDEAIRTGRRGPYIVEHGADWPMPKPPPTTPPDDEGEDEP